MQLDYVVMYVKMVSILIPHPLVLVCLVAAVRRDHLIQPAVIMDSATAMDLLVGEHAVPVELVNMAFPSKKLYLCLFIYLFMYIF